MSEQKIIDRIRKMLALASDNAATEGERDNALRMAYNLMAKHNIDQSHLDANQTLEQRLRMDVEGWSMLWSVHIHNAMARLFFCKYLRGGKINGTKLHHIFVGKESNAVTASYMATYVVTSVLKEGRGHGWHNLSSEMRSFGLGVADRLYKRIDEIRKAEEQRSDAEPGTALVLASIYKSEDDANLAFLASEGMRVKTSKNKGRGASNHDAYGAGQEFGNRVNLNRQVGTPAAQKVLK